MTVIHERPLLIYCWSVLLMYNCFCKSEWGSNCRSS